MSSGLTPEGFIKKDLAQILEEVNQGTRDVFGESINVSPSSPVGQFNGINSASLSYLWELLELVNSAFDVLQAFGVPLSRLVAFNGLTRLPATKSTALCTFTGLEGTVIPANFEVQVAGTDDIFLTTISNTIGLLGTIDIPMIAKEFGVVQAEANTLTQIVSPLNGLISVTNTLKADLGSDEESDQALRNRQKIATARASQNLIDTLYSTLGEVANVKSNRIHENDTPETNNLGIPPHAFETIIQGGDDTEIANTVFLGKTPGVLTFGNTTVQIVDNQGLPRDIKFTRPILIPIYVTINTINTGNFPATGVQDIKDAIKEYAQQEFTVAKNVERTRLYTPVNSVAGHSVQNLFIGLAPNPTGEVDIPIAFNELSEFLDANIVVNVT